jgi:hypothetical protein
MGMRLRVCNVSGVKGNGDGRQGRNYTYATTKPSKNSRSNNLIICYSRPKNLRDSLMRTKLHEPERKRISNLMQNNEYILDGGFKNLLNTTLQITAPAKV